MYVCMYVCMHVCMLYVCMYVCMYVCIRIKVLTGFNEKISFQYFSWNKKLPGMCENTFVR